MLKQKVDMITARGHIVDYSQPELTKIDPQDLRVHASNMCRYNGAIKWELIRHWVLTPLLLFTLPDAQTLCWSDLIIQAGYAASHDFQEVYVTDVVSGLKNYLPAYNIIEASFEAHVHEQMGLPLKYRNNELVRKADLRALVVEMTALQHPAAARVSIQFGGYSTKEELESFRKVQALSLEECWEQTANFVSEARLFIRQGQK